MPSGRERDGSDRQRRQRSGLAFGGVRVRCLCVRCVLCLVCLPLRVRPRVCPVPVLRFWRVRGGTLPGQLSKSITLSHSRRLTLFRLSASARRKIVRGRHHEITISPPFHAKHSRRSPWRTDGAWNAAAKHLRWLVVTERGRPGGQGAKLERSQQDAGRRLHTRGGVRIISFSKGRLIIMAFLEHAA